jgi:Pyridoxal-dependent decarboxylase conserved domain
LGSQDVWTTQCLLECERSWRRGYSGQILSSSTHFRAQYLPSSVPWQTTASDSALTAIVAARAHYLHEHPGTTLESLVIYVTTQTHSFGAKAAMILGLRVRALDVDAAVTTDNTGLTGEGLTTAVEEDRALGLHPFVLSGYLIACISRRPQVSEPSHSRHSRNDIVRRY